MFGLNHHLHHIVYSQCQVSCSYQVLQEHAGLLLTVAMATYCVLIACVVLCCL